MPLVGRRQALHALIYGDFVLYRAHDACIGEDTSGLATFCSHQIEPSHLAVKIRALNAEDTGGLGNAPCWCCRTAAM
jgi:hypothetical protein